MWYFMLAVSVYVCIYTISYGVWEWKHSNKPAAAAVCIASAVAVIIPAVKIFI